MKKQFLLSIILLIGCQSYQDKEIKTYGINEFFNNVIVYGGYFSSDEKKLIYSSNRDGIYNVYEVEIKNGSFKKLTSSKQESFFVRSFVPGSNDFIYSADKGGNEINHLYLQREKGKTIERTTK